MTKVTTSIDAHEVVFAQNIAQANNWEYISRAEISTLENINDKIIVIEKHKISLRLGDSLLFFHPGLSVLRIKNIISGNKDRFLEACQLQSGSSFLDCTVGLASDSLVASYTVGRTGKVVGLEAIPEIALITKHGLSNFQNKDNYLKEAAKRIEIINIEANEFFIENGNERFDCVYFDPMFTKPNLASSGMNMLRPFAFHKELTINEIETALKFATKCVVVKEMSINKLKELEPSEILGGKNAKIFYGRWNK